MDPPTAVRLHHSDPQPTEHSFNRVLGMFSDVTIMPLAEATLAQHGHQTYLQQRDAHARAKSTPAVDEATLYVVEGTFTPLQQPVSTKTETNGVVALPAHDTTNRLQPSNGYTQELLELLTRDLYTLKPPGHVNTINGGAITGHHPLLPGSTSMMALAVTLAAHGAQPSPLADILTKGLCTTPPLLWGLDARITVAAIQTVTDHGARDIHDKDGTPTVSVYAAAPEGTPLSYGLDVLVLNTVERHLTAAERSTLNGIAGKMCKHNNLTPMNFRQLLTALTNAFGSLESTAVKPMASYLYSTNVKDAI